MKNSNYIEKIFNKKKEEIIIEDVKFFFNSEQEETSVLEFKSGEVEIIDLYKEITAFLNTEGGLLIVGAPREKKITLKKLSKIVCEGELRYSKFRSKDWLIQKIVSNITPSPIGLNIVEFITELGNIFLIDIPQSYNPPHQCLSDGRYYIRMEREAKPAPHGIVQALFQKRNIPNLLSKIEIVEINDFEDEITINLVNNSTVPADKIGFIIDVYNIDNVTNLSHNNGFSFDENENKFTFSENINSILVRVISYRIKFKIKHKQENYLIFVGHWCKDLDFDFNLVVYNPLLKEYAKRGSLRSGSSILSDFISKK